MARTTRRTVGSIVLLTLALVVGTTLVAGPALARETTDGGMTDEGMTDGGNETMTDGTETTEDGDWTSTDDEMGTDSMEGGPTTGEEMIDEEQMDEGQMDEETASDGQPGFGVLLALAALVGAAAFVVYRRR